jgi:hypothetical protein
MTPEQFIAKWQAADLKERAAAQSHFSDLCRLLDEPTPTDADPKGEWYAFEKGATKTTGGDGWADVWKRGCFGWEYKSRGRSLDEAIDQLKRYALALENPHLFGPMGTAAWSLGFGRLIQRGCARHEASPCLNSAGDGGVPIRARPLAVRSDVQDVAADIRSRGAEIEAPLESGASRVPELPFPSDWEMRQADHRRRCHAPP